MNKKFPNALKFGSKLAVITLIAGLVIALISLKLSRSSASVNSVSDTQRSLAEEVSMIKVTKEYPNFQNISLKDNSVSEIIEIPPHRCFWLDAPAGWVKYFTINGEPINFEAADGEHNKQSLKVLPRQFRLKGQNGIARIWLEPCSLRKR